MKYLNTTVCLACILGSALALKFLPRPSVAPAANCGCTPRKCRSGSTEASEFCRFTMIQIHEGRVWFKWLDVKGVEHESRMSLEEFRRSGPGEDE